MAGDCNHLQVSSRSYLVVDASRLLCPQLGVGLEYLHVATPCGLYKCGSLVVPDSVVVGYKSKYLRGQCMEIAVFLSSGPENRHTSTSAMFYWYSNHKV